jgi:hypothetical protein
MDVGAAIDCGLLGCRAGAVASGKPSSGGLLYTVQHGRVPLVSIMYSIHILQC